MYHIHTIQRVDRAESYRTLEKTIIKKYQAMYFIFQLGILVLKLSMTAI